MDTLLVRVLVVAIVPIEERLEDTFVHEALGAFDTVCRLVFLIASA